MSFIQNNFRLRDHTQEEMWLIGVEIPNGMRTDERCSMNTILAIKIYNKLNFRLQHYFMKMNLDINDDIFVYTTHASNKSEVMLYEIYKIKTEDTPIVNHFSNWFGDTETLQCTDKDKYERRQNLQVWIYQIFCKDIVNISKVCE